MIRALATNWLALRMLMLLYQPRTIPFLSQFDFESIIISSLPIIDCFIIKSPVKVHSDHSSFRRDFD